MNIIESLNTRYQFLQVEKLESYEWKLIYKNIFFATITTNGNGIYFLYSETIDYSDLVETFTNPHQDEIVEKIDILLNEIGL